MSIPTLVEPTGPDLFIEVAFEQARMVLRADPECSYKPGHLVHIAPMEKQAHWFDASGNRMDLHAYA
jgi:ABC-type sugar transport system ATPase subunit